MGQQHHPNACLLASCFVHCCCFCWPTQRSHLRAHNSLAPNNCSTTRYHLYCFQLQTISNPNSTTYNEVRDEHLPCHIFIAGVHLSICSKCSSGSYQSAAEFQTDHCGTIDHHPARSCTHCRNRRRTKATAGNGQHCNDGREQKVIP